jgi:uncharacterized protein involved in exopolysaccharide biosynthesis
MVYWITAAVFVLSTVCLFLTPNEYTASAKIMPSSSGPADGPGMFVSSVLDASALSGLISSKMSSESGIYAQLLKSRPVLDSVLSHEYNIENEISDLYLRWEIVDGTKARQKLLSLTSVRKDKKTGIVTITVTSRSPSLSTQITNVYVEQLDLFKQSLDRKAAGEISQYLAERLVKQQRLVDSVEAEQMEFYAVNRNYLFSDDPALTLQIKRFEQNVFFQRQLLNTLKQLKASSDMEREKELPRLSVIECAETPTIKSGPRRIRSIMLLTIGGILFAVGLITLKVSYSWYFSDHTRYELQSSYQVLGQDVRSAVQRMKTPFTLSSRSEV